MMNWLFNKKEENLDINYLTDSQKEQVLYKVFPNMILRLNQLCKSDAEFREQTLKLIQELQNPNSENKTS